MKRLEVANTENALPSNSEPQIALKNYKLAKRRAFPLRKQLNNGMEFIYNDIVKRVKLLYQTLPNEADRTVVEINHKTNPYEAEGLASFITPHFYIYLYCTATDLYQVKYQLHNCPFDEQIRKMIKRGLDSRHTFEVSKRPNYPTYFKEVMAFQPDENKFTLDETGFDRDKT